MKLRVRTRECPKEAKGQDLIVALIDEDGKERLLPLKSFVLRCDSRHGLVQIEATLAVEDLEVDATGRGLISEEKT